MASKIENAINTRLKANRLYRCEEEVVSEGEGAEDLGDKKPENWKPPSKIEWWLWSYMVTYIDSYMLKKKNT